MFDLLILKDTILYLAATLPQGGRVLRVEKTIFLQWFFIYLALVESSEDQMSKDVTKSKGYVEKLMMALPSWLPLGLNNYLDGILGIGDKPEA